MTDKTPAEVAASLPPLTDEQVFTIAALLMPYIDPKEQD